MFSPKQIADLLKIIQHYTNVFIASHFGEEYLTVEEIVKLKKFGINPSVLYNEGSDLIKQSFYFGLISDALKEDANKITFNELVNWFKMGKHIPLTEVEKFTLDSIKKQSLNDIRSNGNKIFSDLTGIISSKEKENRVAYEKVIRDEIYEGTLNHKTSLDIARELGKKTGDWSRNFHRIVEFVSHTATSEGIISAIERKGGTKVYMQVYSQACDHCQRLYLTNGLGSQPKIFNIDELKANGNNIGKKVKDWLPVIPPVHPWCRCTPYEYKGGSVWNKGKFEAPKKLVIEGRKPVGFEVHYDNGHIKKYYV